MAGRIGHEDFHGWYTGMLQQLREYRGRYGIGRTSVRLITEGFKHAGILRHSRFLVLYPQHVRPDAYDASLPYERCLMPAADVGRLAAQLPGELSPEFLAGAERRGDLCYVIVDDGRLASFGWYAPETAYLYGRRLGFSRDFVYMYHGYTHPDYRGQRLHALGLAGALSRFCDVGKRAIISTVNATNYRSLNSVERLGFRHCGNILQIGHGRMRFCFATPATRPFAIRIHDDE